MAEQPRKRCLYEVLGLNRDCTQEEIRSAYKRLALQLHPDKIAQSGGGGGGGGADTTAAFQELLHAYEVLSDPKERAWYNSHRSQILFSDPTSASKSNPSFVDVDLFSFFSNSVFNGYTDSGNGFFKVYGDVFGKIYSQELYFAEQTGLPSDAAVPSPLIGNLDSPYSQVTAFYNHWLGFCTVLDFAWVEEYNSSAGINRRSRRFMEEENRKIRKKAKREYNDTVRGLAAFAKKRDKRVLDMQTKRTADEEKRRSEEKERKKEEERKRMERAMSHQEPEWAKNDEKVEFWDDTEAEEDKRKANGKGRGELYCVLCNKKFKSDKQWKNHEQSKKHREKVVELQASFVEEDEHLKDFEEGLSVSFDYVPPPEDDGSGADLKLRDDLEFQEEEHDELNLEDAVAKLKTDDEPDILESMVSGRKNRKDQYVNIIDLQADEHGTRFSNDDEIGKSMEHHDPKSCGNRRGKKGTSTDAEVKDDDDESSGSQRKDSDQINECNVERRTEDSSHPVENVSEIHKGDQAVGKKHKIKKQQSNGKEPAKKDTIPPKNLSKGKKQKSEARFNKSSLPPTQEATPSSLPDILGGDFFSYRAAGAQNLAGKMGSAARKKKINKLYFAEIENFQRKKSRAASISECTPNFLQLASLQQKNYR